MDGSGLQGPMKAYGVVEVSVLRVTCRKLMNGPESIYPNFLYVLYVAKFRGLGIGDVHSARYTKRICLILCVCICTFV